jgi:hypothetical protein
MSGIIPGDNQQARGVGEVLFSGRSVVDMRIRAELNKRRPFARWEVDVIQTCLLVGDPPCELPRQAHCEKHVYIPVLLINQHNRTCVRVHHPPNRVPLPATMLIKHQEQNLRLT